MIKKRYFLFILIPGFFLFGKKDTHAQQRGTELGVRLSQTIALDAVVPFRSHRLHGNLVFDNGLGAALLYDWKWHIDGPLYWYPGVGAAAQFGDNSSLHAVGEIGIGYTFTQAPLSLSVDYRLGLELIKGADPLVDQVAVNIRYVFRY